MEKYGYMRVSTQLNDNKESNQGFDRQLLILQENGVEEQNIFEEIISGGVSTSTRPQWELLLEQVNAGDKIIVTEMSRLARSLQDLIVTVNLLISKGVGITFIKEKIEISDEGMNSMNKLMFNLFGAFAEFEKDLISERTKQGLAAKKAAGVKLGRPSKFTTEQIYEIKSLYMNGVKYADIMDQFNVSKCTLITLAKEQEWGARNKKGGSK